MRKLRLIAGFLVVLMGLGFLPATVSANTPIAILSDVEEILYGQVKTGSLLERIEKVEQEIYGTTQTGAILVRINRVQNFLESSVGGSGLKVRLNLAEWGFIGELTDGQPLINRLAHLETSLLGTPQEGPLADRINNMMMFVWGTTTLDLKQVELRGQSLVKIRLVTPVDSSKNRVGDEVLYRVMEDVVVDGRIVIPAGARGKGTVTEVQSAGRLGRDGRVVIDFGSVPALDGTMVRLRVDEKATEKNRSLELAAGASMAGVLLLGPIGLVGGYFVKGADVQIPVGTEFYVETERAVTLSGFLLRPAIN